MPEKGPEAKTEPDNEDVGTESTATGGNKFEVARQEEDGCSTARLMITGKEGRRLVFGVGLYSRFEPGVVLGYFPWEAVFFFFIFSFFRNLHCLWQY